MHASVDTLMQAAKCCEVSWEVCNKVGGIYTVISSKAQRMVEHYGDGYYAIGPYTSNTRFEERHPPEHLHAIFDRLRNEGIDCHYGIWRIKGEPQTILIDITKYAQYTNGIKKYLWDTYKIDTLGTAWNDVDEPLIWSWAAGKLVEQLSSLDKTVCHGHEWLAGGALLYLAAHHAPVNTVFTTHATVLGRALASEGTLYELLDHVNADEEAAKRGISIKAKHAIEKVTAHTAHVFTTISAITGTEATHLLGRAPDLLLPNGLDLSRYPPFNSILQTHERSRERILAFLRTRYPDAFTPETTRILFLSGREELHDKGMDVFIEALRQLEHLTNLTVAVFFWVPAHVRGILTHGPCTHELDPNDALLQRLKNAGLLNAQHVKVVYYPIYLSENDGLLNLSYDEALQGTQLGVFPSYYEPWGYTPLEAAAYGVPSVTTDLAGFGRFIQPKLHGKNPGMFVLQRAKRSDAEAAAALAKLLCSYVHLSARELSENQSAAHALAAYADWKSFIHFYLDAERRALAQSLK